MDWPRILSPCHSLLYHTHRVATSRLYFPFILAGMKLFTICLFVFYISHVGVQALVIPHHRSGRSDAISHLGSRILDSYNSTKQWFRRKVWGREDVPNMRCNGVENFCTRSYGNITFIGSHNFFAVSRNPLVLSANQNVDVIDQLNLGVRLLQGQVHLEGDKMKLCHTHCVGKLLYDGGLLVDQLRKVKTWLDAHPQEVLTFIFTNPDRVDLRKYWKPQFVDSGLESMMYRPHSGSTHRDSWPTLGELISSGRRVIAFLDYRANTTEVDYLLPEFDNIWETPFSITEAQTLETCKVHRVNGNPNGKMYMINHSMNFRLLGTEAIVPSRSKARTTNSLKSIMKHATECAKLGEGRWPNFVLLDWIDQGAPFEAARLFNNP